MVSIFILEDSLLYIMQGGSKASIVVVGVDMIQGRTKLLVRFTNSGWPGDNFRIYGFLYVLGRGLCFQHNR